MHQAHAWPAPQMWSAQHGIASLELKGYYLKKEHPDELFKAAVSAILLSLKKPQP